MGKTSIDRANRQLWMLGGLIIALVLALVAVVATGADWRQRANDSAQAAQAREAIISTMQGRIDCTSRWIADFTERTEKSAKLDDERLKALDQLARAVKDADPAELHKAVDAYVAASDAYNSETPLPPVPTYTCAKIKVPPLPSNTPQAQASVTVHETVTKPRTVTASPTPGPTKTRTVLKTVTAHAAAEPPGRTVTRLVPVQRTTTRTATTTRTLPAPVVLRTVVRPGPTVTVKVPAPKIPAVTVPPVVLPTPCLLGLLLC